MTEKNYYVLFSDSKKSEKFSKEEYYNIRALARGFNAVLSEVPHRFGTTLSVAFSSSFFYHHYFSIL